MVLPRLCARRGEVAATPGAKGSAEEDLAELAGIGKNTVNRLEKNHTEPHKTTIRKLADALGVDPRELLED